MGLRIKNFNISEVPWKIWFLRGGHKKPTCLKWGAWTVCRFKKGLDKKRGFWYFWEGLDTPMHIMMTKVFCEFFLKCPLKYFVKKFVDKILQSIFYVSAVNCYCTYIFKGCSYRFFGILSRKYFKNSYFDASISNYL